MADTTWMAPEMAALHSDGRMGAKLSQPASQPCAPEQAVGAVLQQAHPHGARLAGGLGQAVHQAEP